jgi:hypothetical protein
VQTCTQCNQQSSDTERFCSQCNADLQEFSTTVVTLEKFRANSRVRAVRVSVGDDACSKCQEVRGTYDVDEVPDLPTRGCSNESGCCCFYEPLLEYIHP